MNRSFFRRRAAKNPPPAGGRNESRKDKKESRKDKKAKKQFGRVGSLQHVRPAYEVNEMGDVEYNGLGHAQYKRRGASEEFERGNKNLDMENDNEIIYDDDDNDNMNAVDEIPPYNPEKLQLKYDSNLADDGLDDTDDQEDANINNNAYINGNGNGYGNDNGNMEGDIEDKYNQRRMEDEREEEAVQPKLGRTRSSKSKSGGLRKKSSGRRNRDKDKDREREKSRDRERERDRDKERDREQDKHRERDREQHTHHRNHAHGRRKNKDNLDEEASLLIELNKLLDTLTSRELQLSLRVDKASDAVREILKSTGSGDATAVRKRAICALKHKKALEKSLAITTAQSDRVLKLLGHNVLTPLSDRIEAAAQAANSRAEEHRMVAADMAPGNANDDCSGESDEQILREIDATIAAATTIHAPIITAPISATTPLNKPGKTLAPPDDSNDWLAEVREQHARRAASFGEKGPISISKSMKEQRPEKESIDARIDDFETVPESISRSSSPRPSREKRADSNSNSNLGDGSNKELRQSKSSSSFSRRRRKSRK